MNNWSGLRQASILQRFSPNQQRSKSTRIFDARRHSAQEAQAIAEIERRARANAALHPLPSLAEQFPIYLRTPHARQAQFLTSPAKRKVIRAGRRGGKTTGIAIYAVDRFLAGRRVLYAAPTNEQVAKFWWEVTEALRVPIAAKAIYKNETEHIIERRGTTNRIRAKTAWNANTLRGDYADELILDEWQLMNEEAWEVVGAPMLLDNDGNAVFIYTPPSLHTRSVSKAKDPRHAALLYKAAASDGSGRWAVFHFTSHDNPHISATALDDITQDMTQLAYRQEILAEDSDEAPGALWKRPMLDAGRVAKAPTLVRVVVGVDPPGGQTEAGIVVVGKGADGHGYVLADYSLRASPHEWASVAVRAYEEYQADRLIGEKNYGGDMVQYTIRSVPGGETVSYTDAQATRGKAIRAEPIAALFEQGKFHHVGAFPHLENELCLSPDTLISTPSGPRLISSIRAGEKVWTRQGEKHVLWAGQTGIASSLVQIETSDNRRLFATQSHPVYTKEKEFVPAAALSIGDTLEVDTWGNMGIPWNGGGNDGISIRKGIIQIIKGNYYTKLYGNPSTALYRQILMFITKMKTQAILTYQILKPCLAPNIVSDICTASLYGTQRDAGELVRSGGRNGRQKGWNVTGAKSGFCQLGCDQNTVPPPVVKSFITTVTKIEKLTPVFNLHVEDAHEFYANGILTHNCTWEPGIAQSPNRLDAMVWAATSLFLNEKRARAW